MNLNAVSKQEAEAAAATQKQKGAEAADAKTREEGCDEGGRIGHGHTAG